MNLSRLTKEIRVGISATALVLGSFTEPAATLASSHEAGPPPAHPESHPNDLCASMGIKPKSPEFRPLINNGFALAEQLEDFIESYNDIYSNRHYCSAQYDWKRTASRERYGVATDIDRFKTELDSLTFTPNFSVVRGDLLRARAALDSFDSVSVEMVRNWGSWSYDKKLVKWSTELRKIVDDFRKCVGTMVE